jgi:pantoate--beta-alanine ligase
MNVLKTIAELDAWRGEVGACVLVPTMGALHEGHASLVKLAAQSGLPVVVSVFVNPTQFTEAVDYDRYPKTLDADVAISQAAGGHAVWAPGVEDVYPNGRDAGVPELPRVATAPGLEDAFRPGHFAGVCQVVLRLFRAVKPVAAVFGEKDWQQLAVVRAMTAMQNGGGGLPVEIVPSPTMRDADGMAMSSRNRFLTAQDRKRGLAISRALRAAVAEADAAKAESVMKRVLGEEGIVPEYAVVRDAETLEAPWAGKPVRRLIAARVGTGPGAVRLIDNM